MKPLDLARARGDTRPSAAFSAACADCPAARIGCFRESVDGGCQFVKASLSAGAPIPVAWGERYAFALVRRGVVIRTRAEKCGASTAIDCAGAGALVPWSPLTSELGYAATDVLVCLYTRASVDAAIVREERTTRDILGGLSAALERVERLAEARGQVVAEDRVASLLNVLADTLSPPTRRERLPTGLRQRDLALLAGVRHESFCRVLTKLELAGGVQRSSDGLAIAGRERLHAAAAGQTETH